MGTPAERAVIAAARFYLTEPGIHEGTPGRGKLAAAVRALDAIEHPTDAGPREITITWDQLVADDELYSEKTSKWFTVTEVKTDHARTVVRLKGVGKPFVNPPDTPARVRRSVAMANALDAFASVIWSGPNGQRA